MELDGSAERFRIKRPSRVAIMSILLQSDASSDLKLTSAQSDGTRSLLAHFTSFLETKPFLPHRLITQGDAQTVGAFLWPLGVRDTTGDEARLFDVEPGTQVLANCRWQKDRLQHPTLVMWHGLEGSVTSGYMLRTADKAFRRGFNVIRVNIRNCGGTEHLTPTIYHGGLTSDLRAVIAELIQRDQLSRIFVAGFSLGGNMVLKLAGEYGEDPPPEIKAICAISPSVDLHASFEMLSRRRNVIYHKNFLFFLKRRIRLKKKLFPNLYDSTGLRRIHTMYAFDDRFVAPAFGFDGVEDYYAKASSLPLIGRIRIPALIIHGKDDPFIPFSSLTDASVASNPFVLLSAPEHGGHVAFLSAESPDEDRFWAENRLVDFFETIGSNQQPSR